MSQKNSVAFQEQYFSFFVAVLFAVRWCGAGAGNESRGESCISTSNTSDVVSKRPRRYSKGLDASQKCHVACAVFNGNAISSFAKRPQFSARQETGCHAWAVLKQHGRFAKSLNFHAG